MFLGDVLLDLAGFRPAKPWASGVVIVHTGITIVQAESAAIRKASPPERDFASCTVHSRPWLSALLADDYCWGNTLQQLLHDPYEVLPTDERNALLRLPHYR